MNGNPAQEEILCNALEKIETRETLTTVEKVVLREYFHFKVAKMSALELKSQNTMLSDEEYTEMQGLKDEIEKLKGHLS